MMCFHASAGLPKDPQPATPPKAILVSRYRFPLKYFVISYGHWLGAVGICLYALAQLNKPRCTGSVLPRRKLATIEKLLQVVQKLSAFTKELTDGLLALFLW